MNWTKHSVIHLHMVTEMNHSIINRNTTNLLIQDSVIHLNTATWFDFEWITAYEQKSWMNHSVIHSKDNHLLHNLINQYFLRNLLNQ